MEGFRPIKEPIPKPHSLAERTADAQVTAVQGQMTHPAAFDAVCVFPSLLSHCAVLPGHAAAAAAAAAVDHSLHRDSHGEVARDAAAAEDAVEAALAAPVHRLAVSQGCGCCSEAAGDSALQQQQHRVLLEALYGAPILILTTLWLVQKENNCRLQRLSVRLKFSCAQRGLISIQNVPKARYALLPDIHYPIGELDMRLIISIHSTNSSFNVLHGSNKHINTFQCHGLNAGICMSLPDLQGRDCLYSSCSMLGKTNCCQRLSYITCVSPLHFPTHLLPIPIWY